MLLILGHLSEKCIEGVTFLDNGGRWAVVVFLFLSGVSLAKTYGLDSLDRRFILNRVRRIAIPRAGLEKLDRCISEETALQ